MWSTYKVQERHPYTKNKSNFFLMETVKRLEVTEVEIREGVSLEDVFGVEFFGYSVKL